MVNVSRESEPGWLPSPEQERRAREAVERFLAARDGGRWSEAYALLNPRFQRDKPLAAFIADSAAFNQQAGPVRQRRVTTVTWTKDPASAPVKGVFAAVDLVSRFAAIDRHCGYVIAYQPPEGGDFTVMRVQEVYLENAQARRLEEAQTLWLQLASACPNYQPDPTLAAIAEGGNAPLPEQKSDIGYDSVAAALADLQAKPGVSISIENGWTIATQEALMTIWSFAPKGHAAYPAVVRRRIVESPAGAMMTMSVHCEASKTACDDLVREFVKLNEALEGRLKRR